MKRCSACGVAKKITAFGKKKERSGNYTYKAACKECLVTAESIRNQYLSIDQKLKRKDKFLQRTYGITIENYNTIFMSQNGRCASCGAHQSEFIKAIVVDHCHKTKKVRGLLCSGCNLALGNVKENPETLEKLASYIRSHV